LKPVLHSISYAGLWRNQAYLPLNDFIKRAAGFGYEAVEITAKRPHAGTLDMDPDTRREIGALLKQLNLECAAMAAYTDFTAGIQGGMLPMAELQLIYINEVIKLADSWGCRLIRVFTGYELENVPYFNQWEACIKAIRECCALAAPYGINIGIQNHHDIALDADTLRDFIEETGCKNCVAMFDPWSYSVRGLDPAADLHKIIDKTAYTTLADYRRIRRFHYEPALVNYSEKLPVMHACAMGEGVVDNAGFIDKLKSLGYDGYVAYEMCSDLHGGGGLDNLDYCAGRFIEFIKKYR